MTRLAPTLLITIALFVSIARSFTGIVYDADAPIARFVIKTRPATWIDRAERDASGPDRWVAIATDELSFAWNDPYGKLMRVAPVLVGVMALTAAGLTAGRRLRKAGSD